MMIDLGRASKATKGSQLGQFPEFNAVTSKPCFASFDDEPNSVFFSCRFDFS